MTAAVVGPPVHVTHHEDMSIVGRRWRTGVILLIVADASFVASLLFSYLYLRGLNTEHAWIAKNDPTAASWPSWALATGLLLAAGAVYAAERGIGAADRGRLRRGMELALLLVVACLVGQVAQIQGFPFALTSSAYGSTMVLIAAANLFHLVLTLFIGTGVWNRSRLGSYTAAEHWQVQLTRIWFVWVAFASLATALTTSFVTSPLAP